MNKALELINDFIDPSDPDLDLPNFIHAYQTAERIGKDYPDNKEFQIVGLIHDLGKILFNSSTLVSSSFSSNTKV